MSKIAKAIGVIPSLIALKLYLRDPVYRQSFWVEFFNEVRAHRKLGMVLWGAFFLLLSVVMIVLTVMNALTRGHTVVSAVFAVGFLVASLSAIANTEDAGKTAHSKAAAAVRKDEADAHLQAVGIDPDRLSPPPPPDDDRIIIHGFHE